MRLVIGLILALAPADLLRQAEAAFAAGIHSQDNPEQARSSFREAARHYRELLGNGIDNPDLYRNLGRAHLLAGDLAESILALRRGVQRYPRDDDLTALLRYARDQVVFPVNGRPGRVPEGYGLFRLAARRTPETLMVAFLSLSLATLAGCRWLTTRRPGWLSLSGTALLVTLGSVGGLLFVRSEQGRQLRHILVVVAEDGVRLRFGNGPSYPPRFETPLNRGVEATLRFQRGDWLQIELAGGEVGWIARSQALADHPGASP